MLTRTISLEPSVDPWSPPRIKASEIVLDMLAAILDNDSQRLEGLIVKNVNQVNQPIGLPFETPNSQFFGHPAMNKMVILQHPNQTLLDVACGMPCGPMIWVLLSHGAIGSKHPLGTDLALHNAIKNGRPYTVQALLVPGRSNVNGVPGTTWKPLFQAVFWNVPEVVRILLDRGACIDDVGLSPLGTGTTYTALELCLQRRSDDYTNVLLRERSNQVLRMLLDTGADATIVSAESSQQSTLAMFIKPWQNDPYWATKLSTAETECLRLFVSRAAHLLVEFNSYPCGCARSQTFAHQALWHSTPSLARLLIDNVALAQERNGSVLLEEILGSCLNAQRHPADTLRDIQVLVQKGVNLQLADDRGQSPLRRCIELCPAVDIVARLQLLLDCGADPNNDNLGAISLCQFAARTFKGSIQLDEVMQALVSGIRGRQASQVDGSDHTWTEGPFPVSYNPSFEEVMSCARKSGRFQLSLRRMVPLDVQDAFQRAHLTVISKNFLDSMTKIANLRLLRPKEKDEITQVLFLRKAANLLEYKFNQELLIALMNSPSSPSVAVESVESIATASAPLDVLSTNNTPSPASTATITNGSALSPIHAPFQFNPSSPPLSCRASSTSRSPQQSTSWLGDDIITSATQIRWNDPCSKPKPEDRLQAEAAVLIYRCSVCNSGNLLTKAELARHGDEHLHTERCEEFECLRRFCAEKRRLARPMNRQSHIFAI